MVDQEQSQDADERRNYYRINDVVYLEYRPVSSEEVALITGRQDQGSAAAPRPVQDDIFQQFSAITKQIAPLLSEIRKESPPLGKFLEGLNKKIDLLAGHMIIEPRGQGGESSTVQERSTVNLSAGGVAFNAERAFEAGEYVHLRIGTAIDGFLIDTYGSVIHCTQESKDPQRPYRLRVKFPFLDESDRRLLVRYVLARQREQIRKQSKEA